MNKLLAATCLVAFAALADGQAVWRFEKADADAAGGPGTPLTMVILSGNRMI